MILKNYFGLTESQFESMQSDLRRHQSALFEKMFLHQRLGQFFAQRVRIVVHGKSNEFLEDLTADCIAHWYEKLESMTYQQFTYGLLTTIIHHYCMRELAKQSRLSEREKGFLEQIQQSNEGYEAFQEADFQLQLNQVAEKTAQTLQQLCEDCRRLFQLYFLDELSERETLAVLGWDISRDALQSLLKQCKLKFQSAYLGVKVKQIGVFKKYFQY